MTQITASKREKIEVSHSCCLFFGLNDSVAQKRGDIFPQLLSLQTPICLPAEHTTAGCGSDPRHDISKRWGSFVAGLGVMLGDLPLKAS